MSSRSTQAPGEANQAFSLALVEFLDKLPDQNRKAFEALKYINNDPQRPVSPNILVSEAKALDDLDKKHRARRFGTRYLKIVRAFEGFFSVIDTVVSSNPTIAGLVWGGIRFILTISTKYFEYFEFVTSTLEDVAEDLYFYDDYAITLYAKWPRVENVLIRIYTKILELCNHVLLPSARTGDRFQDKLRMGGSLLRGILGGGPLKAIAKDLAVCRSMIGREMDHIDRKTAKEERDLAQAERLRSKEAREAAQKEREAQAIEREQAQSHRVAAEAEKVSQEHEKKREITDNFIKSINAVDHTTDHSKITDKVSSPGTNSWLTESEEFLSWSKADDLDCNILWCHGKPGSGKTVLASSAISVGQTMCKGDPSIGMAYFYLKFDDPLRRTASSVRRALCDQLLSGLSDETRIDVVTAFTTKSGRREISSESQITALIFDLGVQFSRVLIFIDGLDECISEDLQGLLSFLCELPRHFRILAFSREWADIRRGLRKYAELPLRIHNTRNEMRDFITSQVHTYLSTHDESLLNDTVHILTDKADGMWLWVALQIKTLRHCNTDADIRAALDDLPADLETSYYRILMRIDGLPDRASKPVRHALRWLVGTLRPLHLDELAQAVALSAFDEDEPGARYSPINDSELLLEHCSDLCMMTYPKANRVVQLIHASVRDYLMTSPTELRNSISDYHITSLPSLHLNLARVCLKHVHRSQDAVMARSSINFEPYFAYARESYLCDHLKAVVPHAMLMTPIPLDKSAYFELLKELSSRARGYDDYFPNLFPALSAITDSLALALALKTDDVPQRLRLAEIFCDLHAYSIVVIGSSYDASFKKAAQTIYRDSVDADGVTQLCITKGRANILYCEFAVSGGISSLKEAITLLENSLPERPKDDPTRYGFAYPMAQYRRDMFLYEGDLEGLTSVLHIYAEAYAHAGDNDVRIKCLQGMIDTILSVMLLGPESVMSSGTVEANVTRIKEQLGNVPEGAGDHLILLQTIEQIIDDHENYYPTWYMVTDILRTRPLRFFNVALAILSTFRGAWDVDLDIHRRCQHGLYHFDGIYTSLIHFLDAGRMDRSSECSDVIWDAFSLELPPKLERYLGAYMTSRLRRLRIRFDVLRCLPQLGQASARRALTQERASDALEILEATQSVIFSPESSLKAVFDHLSESKAEKIVSILRSHYTDRDRDNILDELDGVLKTPSLQSIVLDAMTHINGHIVVLVPHNETCHVIIATNGEDFRHLHLRTERTMGLLSSLQRLKIRNVSNLTMRETQILEPRWIPYWGISLCLWHELVQPILNAIGIPESTLSNLPHITWYPTGNLVNLPFHSAGLYENSESRDRTYRHVISSYALSFSSACQTSPPTVTSRDHTRSLVISQTSSFASPPFIPETKAEAYIITRAIGRSSTGLNEEKATVNRVLTGMEQSNWVHFACHASEHGFHLYDGCLQLQTIMQKSYANARLAYLSACGTAESGRPPLSRSHAEVMSMAGFRTVIAAMSPTADPDARIVAAKFYEYMFSGSGPEGKSAAIALHLAVAHLRERIGENGRNNVERWAPFIHIGL